MPYLNLIMQVNIVAKVNPHSKKNEVIKEEDMFGSILYKVYTTQPPEDGKANKAVIELLAKFFKIPKSKITIIKGETSRTKIITIDVN